MKDCGTKKFNFNTQYTEISKTSFYKRGYLVFISDAKFSLFALKHICCLLGETFYLGKHAIRSYFRGIINKTKFD